MAVKNEDLVGQQREMKFCEQAIKELSNKFANYFYDLKYITNQQVQKTQQIMRNCELDLSSWKKNAIKLAPHGSLVTGQLITATYVVLSKVVLVQGISSTVFLFYQFILATLFIASLALLLERHKRPPLTKQILWKIFLLAFVGVTLAQNMLAGALYFTSSTIEASVLNMVPAITYIMSVASKQEKLDLHNWWGKGKIAGTIVSVSGALVLMLWQQSSGLEKIKSSLRDDMVGLVMVVIGVLAFSAWILMLEPVTRKYPAELSMTAIMFFFATLQTSILALLTSRQATLWRLSWNLELLNIFVGGALNSGLANFFVAWCAGLKGPVFVASFSPLGLLFATIFEMVLFGNYVHSGSILGSVLIIVGLYTYLYSRAKEEENYLDHSVTSPLMPH